MHNALIECKIYSIYVGGMRANLAISNDPIHILYLETFNTRLGIQVLYLFTYELTILDKKNTQLAGKHVCVQSMEYIASIVRLTNLF